MAVKAFRLDLTPEQARALADELQRVAEAPLDHPSIVRPLGAGVEGSLAYLASEYIAGESLDVAMRHHAPASFDKVLPFITQLAGAVDFARAAGIGHGALHPRDIFVTPDEARATGFGLVQALEAIGLRAPVRRPYTAPERVEGARWDVRADVYSLAAIAFELLTGKRPVGAEVGRLGDTAGPHADYVAEALARGLAEDPRERLGNALALAAALEAAGRGERPSRTIDPAPVTIAEPEVAAETQPPPAPPTPPPPVVSLPVPPALASPPAPSGPIEEGQRDLAFEPVPEEPAHDPLAFHRIDREPGEDIGVEHEADLREIRLREGEGEEDEPAAYAPEPDVPDVYEPPPAPPLAAETRPPKVPRAPREPGRQREPSHFFPVALTLLLGLFVGFLAGYLVGARERTVAERTSTAAPPTAPPTSASGERPTSGTAARGTESTRPPETGSREGTPALSREAAPATAAPARGRLVVRSTPPGAQVFIDGRRRGATPLSVRDVAPGTHAVRVARSGYRDETQRISVGASGTRDVSFRLQRVPAPAPAAPAPATVYTGSVYVDSRPRGAEVYIDGRSVGVTPVQVPDVRAGSHVVRIELPDHRAWATSTRVTAGEVARVRASLERIR